nr:hypothetical protein Itr_chr04CG18000 [Ipomoea trifida]
MAVLTVPCGGVETFSLSLSFSGEGWPWRYSTTSPLFSPFGKQCTVSDLCGGFGGARWQFGEDHNGGWWRTHLG